MDIIECRGVDKCFDEGGNGRVEVLTGLDMRVGEREKIAILGVSGSGKSTLLHIIGGLEGVDAGQLSVCGEALGDMNEDALCRLRNRRMGFIYQSHHLLPEFTVLENVSMPLFIGGVDRDEAFERANALLERAQMSSRCSHKPHALSGGERQRVAVCRALVTQPALVLADEPTGNLDGETAARMVDMLLEINESSTLVVVTHDTSIAGRLDRAYRLEHGRLHLSDL